jgi:hypothetical protein
MRQRPHTEAFGGVQLQLKDRQFETQARNLTQHDENELAICFLSPPNIVEPTMVFGGDKAAGRGTRLGSCLAALLGSQVTWLNFGSASA